MPSLLCITSAHILCYLPVAQGMLSLCNNSGRSKELVFLLSLSRDNTVQRQHKCAWAASALLVVLPGGNLFKHAIVHLVHTWNEVINHGSLVRACVNVNYEKWWAFRKHPVNIIFIFSLNEFKNMTDFSLFYAMLDVFYFIWMSQ